LFICPVKNNITPLFIPKGDCIKPLALSQSLVFLPEGLDEKLHTNKREGKKAIYQCISISHYFVTSDLSYGYGLI